MAKYKYSKITISGRVCTGKTTLFWDLQKELGWPTFSASYFFRDYAAKNHASLEKAEEQGDQLTQIIDYGMKELAEKKSGNIILEGWMAGVMTRNVKHALRILLVCDDDVRVKRFSDREKLTIAKSKKMVSDREKNLFNTLEKIYKRRDFVNPKNFNLVLDTTNSTPRETLQEVLEALKK
ncbi:AAA family ATPase [Patescibacteria group bacterium]